jgi:hypothetical protein
MKGPAWLRGVPLPGRYALIAATSAGLVGAIVGLIIGVAVHPPTAPFAAVEAGLPAAVVGALIGFLIGAGRRIWQGRSEGPRRAPHA